MNQADDARRSSCSAQMCCWNWPAKLVVDNLQNGVILPFFSCLFLLDLENFGPYSPLILLMANYRLCIFHGSSDEILNVLLISWRGECILSKCCAHMKAPKQSKRTNKTKDMKTVWAPVPTPSFVQSLKKCGHRPALLLVAMPFAPSSFLFLVLMPGATSSVLATSSNALCY